MRGPSARLVRSHQPRVRVAVLRRVRAATGPSRCGSAVIRSLCAVRRRDRSVQVGTSALAVRSGALTREVPAHPETSGRKSGGRQRRGADRLGGTPPVLVPASVTSTSSWTKRPPISVAAAWPRDRSRAPTQASERGRRCCPIRTSACSRAWRTTMGGRRWADDGGTAAAEPAAQFRAQHRSRLSHHLTRMEQRGRSRSAARRRCRPRAAHRHRNGRMRPRSGHCPLPPCPDTCTSCWGSGIRRP